MADTEKTCCAGGEGDDAEALILRLKAENADRFMEIESAKVVIDGASRAINDNNQKIAALKQMREQAPNQTAAAPDGATAEVTEK